jgi:hypothetical protein
MKAEASSFFTNYCKIFMTMQAKTTHIICAMHFQLLRAMQMSSIMTQNCNYFHKINDAIQPQIKAGIVRCKNVGMAVSRTRECWPSAFNPIVGPRVESEAGDPASPVTPDTAIKTAIAAGLNPNFKPSGTYTLATIGTVENDDPMPMDIKNPTSSMLNDANALLCNVWDASQSTISVIPPLSLSTLLNPAAAIMVNEITAIILKPLATTLSESSRLTTLPTDKNRKPANALTIIFLQIIWETRAATTAAQEMITLLGEHGLSPSDFFTPTSS